MIGMMITFGKEYPHTIIGKYNTMKIRYFTIEGEDSANEFKKLKDFNLFVHVQYSGCDDYHNVIVSDKKVK